MNLSMVPYSKQVMMVGGGDQDTNKKGSSSNEVIDIKPVVEEINCNDSRRFGIINLAEPLLEPIVVKPVTSNSSNMKQHHHSSKFQVKYKECMKNHAASIGGHANDGCGEFMQEADQDNNNNNNARSLRCAACGCHRNFHRKEIHGSGFVDHLQQQPIVNYNGGTNPRYEKTKKHHHHHQSRGGFNSLPSLSLPQVHNNNNQQFLVQHRSSKNNSPINNNNIRDALFGDDDDNTATMDYNNEDRRSETPEERVGMMRNGGSSSNNGSSNKRFRTKFSQEQKDKMLDFADKIGWRIQKQDDNALNQFCLEIGVKRQVLKVWMHNNKNTLRKPQLLGTSSSSGALPTSSSVPAAAPVVMQLQSPPSPSSPAAQHHQHHHHHHQQQHPRSINGV